MQPETNKVIDEDSEASELRSDTVVHAVDLAKPGNYIVLLGAKVDMYRGSMRLAVHQGGKVKLAESTTTFTVKASRATCISSIIIVQVLLLYIASHVFDVHSVYFCAVCSIRCDSATCITG